MKIKFLKSILTVLVFIVLIVLALPEFSFNIGETTFTYPSVGFSKINVPVDYGSFTKGEGVYATEQYSASVDLSSIDERESKDEVFQSIVNTISERLNYAGLHDMHIYGESSNDSYTLRLNIPIYVDDNDLLANWIFAQGNIGFNYLLNPEDPASVIGFEVTDKDVIAVDYTNSIRYQQVSDDGQGGTVTNNASANGGNLLIKTDERVINEVRKLPNFINYANQFYSGQLIGSVMTVDDSLELQIIRDDFEDSLIRALFSEASTAKSNYNILSIVQSYFREAAPIGYDITVNEEISAVAPTYNPEGTTMIALSFIVGVGLLILNFSRKLKLKKTAILGSSLAFVMLLTTVILKLVQTPISIGFVIGIFGVILLSTFMIFEVLDIETSEELNEKVNGVSILSIVMIFGLVTIGLFNLNLGSFIQTLEALVGGLIAFIITIQLHTRFLVKTFVIDNTKLRQILGL